jgi:hypothetical protein
MISNPNWQKPEFRPNMHQISFECMERLVDCMEGVDIEDMDCDTCLKMQEILSDEIDDEGFLEFAIENFSELFGYIASGIVNIRIHKDVEGHIWFGVG